MGERPQIHCFSQNRFSYPICAHFKFNTLNLYDFCSEKTFFHDFKSLILLSFRRFCCKLYEKGDVDEMKRRFPERALTERREELKKLIIEKQSALKHAPAGSLCTRYNRGYIQYYVRKSAGEKTGKYLRKSEKETLRRYLQKQYDSNILADAEKELAQINRFLSEYDPGHLLSRYEQIDIRSRTLIQPIGLPDEAYIEEWLQRPYDQMGFKDGQPEYLSANGERVRSKSEALIADLLAAHKIPFLYEFPLTLKKHRTIRPDFTLLDVRHRREIYWEHFGMMDDHEYCRNAILKIREYNHSGYFPGRDCLFTFESYSLPLSVADAEAELMMLLERD